VYSTTVVRRLHRSGCSRAAADCVVLDPLGPRFCEQLDYNLLFRWFLDMSLDEAGLDQSNFSWLRERLVDTMWRGASLSRCCAWPRDRDCSRRNTLRWTRR